MTSTVIIEVGKEVEALCKTCKGPAIHVIETIKKDKIDKVLCKGCNKSHKYKPVEVEEEGVEKAAKKPAKKRAVSTKTKEERKWSRLLNKVDSESPIDYAMSEIYNEKDVLSHTKFGVGVVHEVIDHTKVSVVFKEGTKVLIQNR